MPNGRPGDSGPLPGDERPGDDDRLGDLGRREPTTAEKLHQLDERELERERDEQAGKPPDTPRPAGRYTWVVGVAALIVVIVVAFNSLPNAGRGYRGPEQGKLLPVFAAPSVAAARDADANVKQDRADEDAGNETPACEVRARDVITACELSQRKPLVLALAVPSADCERQLEAAQRLQGEFPQVQFAAVVSGRSRATVRELTERAGLRFPVAVDRDLAVFNLYRIAYCSTAFVERGGILREFRANKPLSEAQLRDGVERLAR